MMSGGESRRQDQQQCPFDYALAPTRKKRVGMLCAIAPLRMTPNQMTMGGVLGFAQNKL